MDYSQTDGRIDIFALLQLKWVNDSQQQGQKNENHDHKCNHNNNNNNNQQLKQS